MKGTDIQLAVNTIEGYDEFGAPIVREDFELIPDCLVGQPTSQDIIDSLNLYGKKLVYVVGIPKGDTHDWENREVIIWGERYKTFGYTMTGIQENIPLRWGANVKVERYG